MKYTVTNPETEQRVATVDCIDNGASSTWTVTTYGEAEQKHALGEVRASLSGQILNVHAADHTRFVFPVIGRALDGAVVVATALGNIRFTVARGEQLAGAAGARAAQKAIKSSMPGKILKLLCKAGDKIEAGQPLLIIEAMKMENEIRAVHSGVIEEIVVQPGQKVETGEILLKLGTGES